jgi:nucleotide-binding universal stress UspA family protein
MQVRRVLGAVSLCAPSPKAALAAAELAAAASADLEILTVLRDPWELVRPDEVEGFRRTHLGSPASLAATRAVERLKTLTRNAVLPAPRVSYQAAFGLPSIEIARFAETAGADVIVLGRGDEGARGASENVMTATMRRSHVPVLLAPLAHRVYRTVVACMDESPRAVDVLEVATTWAETFGAGLLALHVEPSDAGPVGPGERRPWLQRLEGGSHGGDLAVVECETAVRQGDVTTEILAEAAARDAELIVFGYRRGMNYGDAGASGTVAARLLRRGPCALLAVPV